MNFEGDAFISYAHIDNMELIEGRKGWVANLHRALEVRVGQLLGKSPQIWRDPKLQGNDFFAETLMERLKRVVALISVVSPRYVKSEWTRKELSEFWKAAEAQGGVCIGDKARIFKVLKTPVPRELHPPELCSLLGYEFYKVDSETGKVRELDDIFGPEAQKDFWVKLDDLAHDICCLLQLFESPEGVLPGEMYKGTVFLAETTFDLKEQREDLKRELQQRGYAVLPDRELPHMASDMERTVREYLSLCQMSIHLVGRQYSLIPEGGAMSLLETQHELAIQRGQLSSFSRLVWIPPGLHVEDPRQSRVIEQLRINPRIQDGADLLETPFSELKTVIQSRLTVGLKDRKGTCVSVPTAADADLLRLYLICDRRDAQCVLPWADLLFDQQFEVMNSVFEGEEAEIRECHEESLRMCDGVLIFYGASTESWLRRKLREVQKSAGYGRSKPRPAVGIVLIPPRTPEKEHFRTHEASVIPQFEGISPASLQKWTSLLKA